MKKKPKPWIPVLKEHERYLVFTASEACDRRDVERAVLKALGEIGAARAGYRLIELEGKRGIIRTNSTNVEEVIAALTLSEKPVFQVFAVSGTLKKARTNARNL